jgi:hypothetical protein
LAACSNAIFARDNADPPLGRQLLELEIPLVQLAKLLGKGFELDGEVSVCVFGSHSRATRSRLQLQGAYVQITILWSRCKASAVSGTL